MKKNNLLAPLIFFLMSLIGGALGARLTSTPIIEQTHREEYSIADVVKKVNPAVIHIVATKNLTLGQNRSLLDKNPKQLLEIGGGTGFIVSKEGLVLTSHHVVNDTEADYSAVLTDGRTFKLSIVHNDPIHDVSLVKLSEKDGSTPSNLPMTTLDDSDELQVGQQVIAIGNAMTENQNTVTAGIISAKGRSIQAGGLQGSEVLSNLLQTDTAINPGNSGGPLFNLAGQVIGMITALAPEANKISFAIPSNDLRSILETENK